MARSSKSKKPKSASAQAAKEPKLELPADTKRRRRRAPDTLPRRQDGAFLWATSKREELVGFDLTAQANALRESAPWQNVMLPALAAHDRRASARIVHDAETNEIVEWIRAAGGYLTTKATLIHLKGEFTEEQRCRLRLVRPDEIAHPRESFITGVPSAPMLSRHRIEFGYERRAEIWKELERLLLAEQAAYPEFAEEIRITNVDGTHVQVAYTCPAWKEGEDGLPYIANDERVTCRDGGTLPLDSHGRGGDGFDLMMASTSVTGVPVAWRIEPMNVSQKTSGRALLLEQLRPIARPFLRDRSVIGVLNMDGVFADPEIRRLARSIGYLENTHAVSHANDERGAEFSNDWRPIEGYNRWYMNMHRELRCYCGAGDVTAIAKPRVGGTVRCHVAGTCSDCGRITLTSGEWVFASNPSRWIKHDPSDPKARPDLQVGNLLTYNNWLAEDMGTMRWSHNEGLHGALTTRCKLLTSGRFFKTAAQAEIDVAMVLSAMHVCSLETRRRRADGNGLLLAA